MLPVILPNLTFASLLSPLGKFECTMHLHDLGLEEFNFASTLSLNIVDVHVNERLDSAGGEVGPDDGLGGRVGGAVGVRADDIRLDRLVLAVDEDLLKGRERGVVRVMPTEHDDAVIIELLDLLDCGELVGRLKVVLAEEGGAD